MFIFTNSNTTLVFFFIDVQSLILHHIADISTETPVWFLSAALSRLPLRSMTKSHLLYWWDGLLMCPSGMRNTHQPMTRSLNTYYEALPGIFFCRSSSFIFLSRQGLLYLHWTCHSVYSELYTLHTSKSHNKRSLAHFLSPEKATQRAKPRLPPASRNTNAIFKPPFLPNRWRPQPQHPKQIPTRGKPSTPGALQPSP